MSAIDTPAAIALRITRDAHYHGCGRAWLTKEIADAIRAERGLRARPTESNPAMAMSQEDRLICRQRFVLQQINEAAVNLRDKIGTGPAVAGLRDGVQTIVELSRSVELNGEG